MEKVNNFEIVIFLINEIYLIDKQEYFHIRARLKSRRELLPALDELNGELPGSILKKKLDEFYSGYNNNSLHQALSYLKKKFIAKYISLLNIPIDSLKSLSQSEKCTKIFEFPIVERFESNLHDHITHEIEKGERIVFCESTSLDTKAQLEVKLIDSINLTCHTQFESFEEARYFVIENKIKIFIYNNQCLSEIENTIIERFLQKDSNANLDSNTIIDGSKNEVPINSNVVIQSKGMKRLSKYLLFTSPFAFLILIVFLMSHWNSGIPKEERRPIRSVSGEVYHFSTGLNKDTLIRGFTVSFLDSAMYPIKREKILFANSYSFTIDNPLIKHICISKETHEIFPRIIELRGSDENSHNIHEIYRRIVIGETLEDTLSIPDGNKWYVVELERETEVRFLCNSLSKEFSPQIAIFKDRLGLERIATGKNPNGKNRVDIISVRLKAGKYYLKLRSFKLGFGKFEISLNTTKNYRP